MCRREKENANRSQDIVLVAVDGVAVLRKVLREIMTCIKAWRRAGGHSGIRKVKESQMMSIQEDLGE